MLIFIHGSDSFLAREAISKLKAKYLEKNPDGGELIEIDCDLAGGADLPFDRLRANFTNLKTVPLFATSRLIIIKRVGELPVAEQADLASMLADLPDSSVVAVWDAKPLKAGSALLTRTNNAQKLISAEPLVGTALKNWIKAESAKLGTELSPESISELTDQYGSDLWAIQTDFKTRGPSTELGVNRNGSSSWSRAQEFKPFALFDFVRGKKWGELRKHLIESYERGEAVEMTIGGLASAVRKNVPDQKLKTAMTTTLSQIDIALKSGLIEAGDAVALLVSYLPDAASTPLSAGKNRVQWEEAWESLA